MRHVNFEKKNSRQQLRLAKLLDGFQHPRIRKNTCAVPCGNRWPAARPAGCQLRKLFQIFTRTCTYGILTPAGAHSAVPRRRGSRGAAAVPAGRRAGGGGACVGKVCFSTFNTLLFQCLRTAITLGSGM